ncbi:outer membrane beta-barrel protein [Persephonella sp. IF05-L8]|uniref:outer membrane beta-barrel protein n=1 Tax=Persephonella sp. IF05-L8 TaxID=1158338 RepID=UPI0004952BD7
MKKALSLVAAGLLAAGAAQAGTLTVANSDIEMTGGVTAGYFYATNIGNKNNDYFVVPNFAIDLTSKVNSIIGFTASFGRVEQATLLCPKAGEDATFGVDYAWVSIRPIEGLTIDAGKLTTNIGYELYHTYDNKNYIFGLVWNAQPVTYPGARATYSVMDGIDVYAEYNQDGRDAFAIGSLGSVAGFNYAISYYDYTAFKNLIDVVLSTEISGIEIGTNIDYQWLDDTAKTPGNDDSAYGIALYLSTKIDVFEIPVRIEYVNDGTSEIYSVAGNDAWTFTITPTWRPTQNTFLRAEFAYISTDKKGFPDDNGVLNQKDSRTVMGVEAGFVF